MSAGAGPLLEARGLTITVPGRTLCRDLYLQARGGEFWGLLGPNGAGKSSLLLALAGIRTAAQGTVALRGRPLQDLPRRQVARELGLLPQDSADPFPSSVFETALMGRHPYLATWQREGATDVGLAERALEAVGLRSFRERQVDSLSGGERRRLAIATLLTQSPTVLLLDEPTNHLDLRHQITVLSHLQGVTAQGCLAMAVLHDPALVYRFCNRVLLLFGDGSWEAGETRRLLDAERLGRLYGHAMTAVDTPDGRAFLPKTDRPGPL